VLPLKALGQRHAEPERCVAYRKRPSRKAKGPRTAAPCRTPTMDFPSLKAHHIKASRCGFCPRMAALRVWQLAWPAGRRRQIPADLDLRLLGELGLVWPNYARSQDVLPADWAARERKGLCSLPAPMPPRPPVPGVHIIAPPLAGTPASICVGSRQWNRADRHSAQPLPGWADLNC